MGQEWIYLHRMFLWVPFAYVQLGPDIRSLGLKLVVIMSLVAIGFLEEQRSDELISYLWSVQPAWLQLPNLTAQGRCDPLQSICCSLLWVWRSTSKCSDSCKQDLRIAVLSFMNTQQKDSIVDDDH